MKKNIKGRHFPHIFHSAILFYCPISFICKCVWWPYAVACVWSIKCVAIYLNNLWVTVIQEWVRICGQNGYVRSFVHTMEGYILHSDQCMQMTFKRSSLHANNSQNTMSVFRFGFIGNSNRKDRQIESTLIAKLMVFQSLT